MNNDLRHNNRLELQVELPIKVEPGLVNFFQQDIIKRRQPVAPHSWKIRDGQAGTGMAHKRAYKELAINQNEQ